MVRNDLDALLALSLYGPWLQSSFPLLKLKMDRYVSNLERKLRGDVASPSPTPALQRYPMGLWMGKK